MSVSLSKGGNVNLTKAAPGFSECSVGLGWEARTTDGAAFDLDASAFMLTPAGRVRSDADFIFYNNRRSLCGSVEHGGDNTTGDAAGDDETLKVSLASIPNDVARIAFCVTIHEAESRRQNFGMVSSAFIRIVDIRSNHEVARYDLSEDASIETSMVFGELYRHTGEWKFKAVGQGFTGGLAALARGFGINIG